MSSNQSLREQLRRNAVALISLTIAITSLGYNTWRNEASEGNRNQRLVAIQILVMLGELQQAVLHAAHGKESDARSYLREGWAITLTVRDIAMVSQGKVPEKAEELFEIWNRDSKDLESRVDEIKIAAQKSVESAIDAVRYETQEVLQDLD